MEKQKKRCQSGSGAIIKTGHQMFPAPIVVLSRVAPGSRRGLSFARAPLEGRAGVVRDVESALPLFGACVHGGVEGVENSTIVFQLSTGKASLHEGTGVGGWGGGSGGGERGGRGWKGVEGGAVEEEGGAGDVFTDNSRNRLTTTTTAHTSHQKSDRLSPL